MQYLGSIVVPAGGSANNRNTTGSPFVIPLKFTTVLVETPPEAAGFNVEVGVDVALTSDATQFNVPGGTSNEFTAQPGSAKNPVVAIYNAGGGGTCRIYGLYGLAVLDRP
jgi:hypothetical protein